MSRSERLRRLEALQAPADLTGGQTLDTVGLYCPIPIMRAAERIRSMEAGEVIEVISDDRVILVDMPAWCLSTGHDYLGFKEGRDEWRLYVRKK